MINVEFLKTLTILYVEDDDQIREKFGIILKKLCKGVFLACDGVEGLQKYHQSNKDRNYIDLIISDITMPNMDGVELLTHIRKIDSNIPFIFTTAYTNTDFLITSIQEGVTDYFVKPVDAKQIIQKVQKTCEIKNKINEIIHYQNETQKYLDAINKVAIVSIYDKNGDFSYVNDFFVEVSQYSEEELIGENLQKISHPDISKIIYEKMWKTLHGGKIWKGKLKHLSKHGQSFYTNTTIMPMNYDDIETKYISIRFLTTKDENKKREYKKKVFFSLQETKKINQAANDKITELKQEITRYKKFDIIEDKLENQKKISAEHFEELQSLESRIIGIQKSYQKLLIDANKEIRLILDSAKKMKERKESALIDADTVKKEIQIRVDLIRRLRTQVNMQSRKIIDLKDVVQHRDKQLSSKE